jgi:hypothetical protein
MYNVWYQSRKLNYVPFPHFTLQCMPHFSFYELLRKGFIFLVRFSNGFIAPSRAPALVSCEDGDIICTKRKFLQMN